MFIIYGWKINLRLLLQKSEVFWSAAEEKNRFLDCLSDFQIK